MTNYLNTKKDKTASEMCYVLLKAYYFGEIKNNPAVKTKIINRLVKLKFLPKIEKIWIETVNTCNAKCPFCPIGLNMNTEQPKIMSEDEFDYIINKLASSLPFDFDGTIAPFGHGEPFLDPNIINRVNKIKNKFKSSRILLSSNGIKLMNVDITNIINSKLDYLIINFYDKETEHGCYKTLIDNNIKAELYTGDFGPSINRCKIFYRRRYNIEDNSPKYEKWYTNRVGILEDLGGQVPDSACILPFFQLPIDVYGNIKMCCYDTLGLTRYDNIFNIEDLNSWWNSSEKRLKILNDIVYSRKLLPNCEKCNTNDCEACENMLR